MTTTKWSYLEMTPVKCTIIKDARAKLPQKTANTANTSFPHEVTSEKRVQKILRERERSTFFVQASLHNQKLVSIRGGQIPY